MMKQVFQILIIVGLLLLAIAACSSRATPPEATVAAPSGGDTATVEAEPTAAEATAAPTDPPTEAPTDTTEPTEPPTDTPEPAATETAAPSERAAVSIQDFLFSPGSLSVSVGSTVTWTHTGNARHTVTADDGSFNSDTLSSGGTFTATFDAPGTYAYYCRLHGAAGGEGMSAVITVTE